MRLVALGIVLLVGCGGAAAPVSAPSTGVAAEAAPQAPPSDDGRFASDVPSPPPPRPMRQIDRGDVQRSEAPPREVDKTLAADQSGGGGGATTPTQTVEAPHDAQMLVYTAHVTMAVYQVAPALDAIEAIARSMGGYLSSRNDTQIEIRVPRARFDDALHKVEASGDVVHRDVSAQDVTDAYVDIESRLKNSRAVRDRLQALLEKASVKEAIEIQRELERVTGEIEVLEGKLKLLSNRVAYSTIDVTFQPRGNAALQQAPVRLPFPWLGELGLPKLLNLGSQ
jgi:hypothetical protein